MDYYAKQSRSNEFFARRAIYNAKCKRASGDTPGALHYLRVAEKCIRVGGCSEQSEQMVASIRDYYRTRNYFQAVA